MKGYVFLFEFHKFVPKGPALVQVTACRLTGNKPLPEPMLAQFTDAHMWHYGEMS